MLIEKNDQNAIKLIKMFHEKKSNRLILCDMTEFKPDGDSITIRGIHNKFYIDGKLEIDLSDEAKDKYYRLCTNNKF